MKNGIHYNVTPSEYHGWAIDRSNLSESPVSCSMLKQFAPSPYDWFRRDRSPADSDAMKWGRLIDTMILTPDQFPLLYAILPDDAPAKPTDAMRNAKKPNDSSMERVAWWDRFESESRGKDVIGGYLHNKARNAVSCILDHREASELILNANTQVAAVHRQGVPFKSLVDAVPQSGKWEDALCDLKTTSGGLDDDAISKAIYKFKYHWQAAFYLWVWNKAAPDDQRSRFAFIFQDSDSHEVRVVEIDRTALETAMSVLRIHIADYLRRVKDGDWSSRYATGADRIFLPVYGTFEEEAFVDANETESK
jgi:hypothetical protein